MKRYIVILSVVILITGCNKRTLNKIEMDCNGEKIQLEVKKNDELTCELLKTKYVFRINISTKKEIEIVVNKPGIIDSNSLLDKKTVYNLKKGKELRLNTQSTDYQEYVAFNWK